MNKYLNTRSFLGKNLVVRKRPEKLGVCGRGIRVPENERMARKRPENKGGVQRGSGNFLGTRAPLDLHCDFSWIMYPFRCLQAMSIRILTINEGEECLIRVNSRLPITLEFPSHLVSVYEQNGLIFQRVEKQDSDCTQEAFAPPDDNAETQEMDLTCYEELENAVEVGVVDIEETQIETQIETHIETQIETQIDDFPASPSCMKVDLDVAYNMNHAPTCDQVLSRTQMEDIEALQKILFG